MRSSASGKGRGAPRTANTTGIGVLACALALALTGAACAGLRRATPRALPPPSIVGDLAGGSTLALPRPTPSVARLSLWIGVGSRDGSPPQLITAAAWLMAERASAEARVEPYGTELSQGCDVAETGLRACLERFLGAVTRTEVSDQDALRMRERLRTARQNLAGHAWRSGDERAISALIAAPSDGFFPLGRPEGDAGVTAQGIRSTIAGKMGLDRSILIGAGDVDDVDLADAFARFRPRRVGPSAPRSTRLALRNDVLVSTDAQTSLSFAMAAPDPTVAAAIGVRIEDMYPGAVSRVARMPGFALLHLRVPGGGDPMARLQRTVFDLRRLALESPGPAPERSDALPELTREVGELWLAGRAAPTPLAMPWPLGISVTLAKGAGSVVADTKRKAVAAVERGSAYALGPVEGRMNAGSAEVTTPHGLPIRVQRRPGDRWMGAVIRLDHGSSHDPQDRHGRAALLATWLSNGCGFAQGESLALSLRTMGARMSPISTAAAIAIRIDAPAAHWQQALDSALRCAVRPSVQSRVIEDARLRLLGALSQSWGAGFEALTAEALSSSTPGFVATWGTPQGVSRVSGPELTRLHRELMRASALSVTVAVDADPEAVARFVSRRVAHLEDGASVDRPQPGALGALLHGTRQAITAPRAIVALRADGDSSGYLAPRVVAEALAGALGVRVGRAIWRGGDSQYGFAYASVAVGIAESELDVLPTRVETAIRELAQRDESRWRQAIRSEELDRSAQGSDAGTWAAATLLAAPSGPPSVEDELDLVRRLLSQRPSLLIARPSP